MPEKSATRPGLIAAASYHKDEHGIPKCVECGAKLRHVPAHLKHGGNTEVSAHFGLRKGQKHASGCKYDIDATLRKIVAKSREIRDLGAAALVEHVGSPEQGTVEFRLHVLLLGLETEEILGCQGEDPEKAYAYRHSKRCLSTYMNCVESIVIVADVVGDDAQLEEKVHVVFNGEKIPWRDFFFGFKEHRRLWRALDKTQGRPVTLEFERRDLERKVAAPYRADGHYQISGRFDLEKGDPSYYVQVQLQVGDKALADAIWGAKQVVVCGVPRFKAPDFARWRPGERPPFAHIVLPIRDWSQVFAVGSGSFEAPLKAADRRPSHVTPRYAVFDMPRPDGGVPAMGMPPPEAQPSPDVPPIENTPPGGTASEHSHPEPEQSKPAPGGLDTAGDAPSPDVGRRVPSSRQADPEPDPISLDLQPIEPETLSETEALGNAESLVEWGPETEETVARPDDGAAPAQMPPVAAKTAQPTAMAGTVSASAASASQVLEQKDAQPSPYEAASIVSPPMSVTSDARSRRSRGSVAHAAKAVKKRAAKVVERGRSVGRRFIAWFGGRG